MAKNGNTLDSWKEIASFLGRGVRTVQRWEASEALPVRRHHLKKRGSVYALRSEVELWLKARRRPDGANGHTVAQPSSLTDQLTRLQALTMRQTILTHELRQILAKRPVR